MSIDSDLQSHDCALRSHLCCRHTGPGLPSIWLAITKRLHSCTEFVGCGAPSTCLPCLALPTAWVLSQNTPQATCRCRFRHAHRSPVGDAAHFCSRHGVNTVVWGPFTSWHTALWLGEFQGLKWLFSSLHLTEVRGCRAPPPPNTGEGKEKRETIIVVIRSPCQENYPADAHPRALKSVLESANPRMDSECASGCPWSTARATARLWGGRPPE